jgi:mannose/cellobiose epimerase-like protein (N-acyl-D-glucosamine 2-epimerase family)
MAAKHLQQIRRWLSQEALPLWSGAGVDPAGGFVERLTLTGSPDYTAPKRVRVQARQIYVFSHCAVLGLWPNGRELALRGFEFLRRSAWVGGEGGGWACIVDRHGKPLDARHDTYDHAFVLLALAWLYRATADEAVLETLRRTLGAIDRMKDRRGLGYLEPTRIGAPRWQNPHMHLLEAFLSAHKSTGDKTCLDRARDIADLFERHLFDPKICAMREYFTQSWQPAPGEAGTIIEPGHQFEWVWLLNEFAQRTSSPPSEAMGALYSFAVAHGLEPGTGLVLYELFADGRIKAAHKRCWAQTEALKAELVMCERRGERPNARADSIVDNLFGYFLGQPVRGGWNDVVGPDNRPISDTMPASTLYHVFLAFMEYLRIAEDAPNLSR